MHIKKIKPGVCCSFGCVRCEIPLDLQFFLGKNIPSLANNLKLVIDFKHIQVHTYGNNKK